MQHGGHQTRQYSPPGIDADLMATIQRLESAEETDYGGGGGGGGIDGGGRMVVGQAHAVKYDDMLPPAMEDMGAGTACMYSCLFYEGH